MSKNVNKPIRVSKEIKEALTMEKKFYDLKSYDAVLKRLLMKDKLNVQKAKRVMKK